MVRKDLSPKKSCFLLICRDGPLLPAGFNFLWAFHHSLGVGAGEQSRQGAGPGEALALGLSALDGFSGVQHIKTELLASVQKRKESPYVRDRTASLYSIYLQAWKAAKIVMTAIVCTYNFPVVLLNWVFLNKHFGKSSSPSCAVWGTLHSSDSQDTKGVCFYRSILDESSPLACSVTQPVVLHLYSQWKTEVVCTHVRQDLSARYRFWMWRKKNKPH